MNCNLVYNSLFTVYNSLFGPNRASSRPNVVVPFHRSTTSSPRQLHTEFGPNIRQTSIPAGPLSFMFSRFTIQNFRLQFDPRPPPQLHLGPLNKIDNKYDTSLSFISYKVCFWRTSGPKYNFVRPQAEPPTHFTNLFWAWSTSVTDLITNLSRWQPLFSR